MRTFPPAYKNDRKGKRIYIGQPSNQCQRMHEACTHTTATTSALEQHNQATAHKRTQLGNMYSTHHIPVAALDFRVVDIACDRAGQLPRDTTCVHSDEVQIQTHVRTTANKLKRHTSNGRALQSTKPRQNCTDSETTASTGHEATSQLTNSLQQTRETQTTPQKQSHGSKAVKTPKLQTRPHTTHHTPYRQQ